MDQRRVTCVRKKTGEGNFTAPVPIGAKAENVTLANGTVLQDAIEELQSGKAGHEVLSYADFQALTDKEKNNGTVYFVHNYNTEHNNQAVLVSFNNNESGMAAKNVQTAIEELNYKIAPPIVDNLDSINPNATLSARQGKILNETKQNQIIVNPTAVSMDITEVTMNTANTYYRVGTQSFTFEANSTYLICVHIQASDTTNSRDASLTFALGESSNNSSRRKITVKIAADTAGMPRYAHFSTIIHFQEETTYYGWLASTLNNATANALWQMECLKIA